VFKCATHIVLLVLSTTLLIATANARPKHYGHRAYGLVICNQQGCSDRPHAGARAQAAPIVDANGNSVVVGHRPAGCPHAYCGCEASLYVFGTIRPMLNVARNWRAVFPRTAPAPGMAAVRAHHVMILMSHVGGSRWLVHDGNSGGGKTREHVMSIAGYTVVDPHGSRSGGLSARASFDSD
jgi:hypothetical protein